MAEGSSMQAGKGDGGRTPSPSPLLRIDEQWSPILEYAKKSAWTKNRTLYVFKHSEVWFITKYPPMVVFPAIKPTVTLTVSPDRTVQNWRVPKGMRCPEYASVE